MVLPLEPKFFPTMPCLQEESPLKGSKSPRVGSSIKFSKDLSRDRPSTIVGTPLKTQRVSYF